MFEDAWALVFDIDGAPTRHIPQGVDFTLKMFLKQIKALLMEEYDEQVSTKDMLVLEACGLTKKGLYKISFHVIIPGMRVDGVKGRRQLQALIEERKKAVQCPIDDAFDTKIYGREHFLRSVESVKQGGRPLKLATLAQFPFALKGNVWCQSSKCAVAKLYAY